MRFSPLLLSMRTLVSRKPSTIGLRTKAAGARTVLNFGSSLALKVIAVSFQGFIAAIWQTSASSRSALLRLLFEVNVSKTVSTSGLSFSGGVLFWCILGEDILAALGHLPEYPTCSKAVGWYVIRCCVYFAWPIKPSFQNGSAPRSGFVFLYYWDGRATRVHPFRLNGGLSVDRRFPTGCLSFPGAFHCAVLLYDSC